MLIASLGSRATDTLGPCSYKRGLVIVSTDRQLVCSIGGAAALTWWFAGDHAGRLPAPTRVTRPVLTAPGLTGLAKIAADGEFAGGCEGSRSAIRCVRTGEILHPGRPIRSPRGWLAGWLAG